MDIVTSYGFLVVAVGTAVLAFGCGMVGTMSVLKGQSLIGDVLGHAAFPGVVLAFMVTRQRDLLWLFGGAVVMSIIAFSLVRLLRLVTNLPLDTNLAIVLSTFFGLGMVLKSYIQGHPEYASSAQSGLQGYIFGQAAYVMERDVWAMLIITGGICLAVMMFYPQLKLYVFDEEYAVTIGLPRHGMEALLLLLTVVVIAIGLKTVGTVLISSLLIAPSLAALQWTNRFHTTLLLAGLFGSISAVAGTYISTAYKGMPTGATIVLVLSGVVLFSVLVGPNGLRRRWSLGGR